MKLLFIDTETTGLNPGVNGLVQVAGIVEIDGVIKEEFNLWMKPFKGDMINPSALETIGKTLNDLEKLGEPSIAYREIITIFDRYIDKFNKKDKFYLVGQNPSFDKAFLDYFFNRFNNPYLYAYIFYHLIDLVAISAAFKLAGVIEIDKLNLDSMAEYFKLTRDKHDALSDVKLTRDLFYIFIDKLKRLS